MQTSKLRLGAGSLDLWEDISRSSRFGPHPPGYRLPKVPDSAYRSQMSGRNQRPMPQALIALVAAVLLAIKGARPDLRLHGFGLKTTALAHPLVRGLLETADSMAWSYHARINGRNGNDYREAQRWAAKIESQPVQQLMFMGSE